MRTVPPGGAPPNSRNSLGCRAGTASLFNGQDNTTSPRPLDVAAADRALAAAGYARSVSGTTSTTYGARSCAASSRSSTTCGAGPAWPSAGRTFCTAPPATSPDLPAMQRRHARALPRGRADLAVHQLPAPGDDRVKVPGPVSRSATNTGTGPDRHLGVRPMQQACWGRRAGSRLPVALVGYLPYQPTGRGRFGPAADPSRATDRSRRDRQLGARSRAIARTSTLSTGRPCDDV